MEKLSAKSEELQGIFVSFISCWVSIRLGSIIKCKLTLWNREESHDTDSVPMSTPDMVLYVPD